jgi:cytochrome c oxidase assembly factor CtaG
MPRTSQYSKVVANGPSDRAFIALLLSSVLVVSLFPPLELIDYVYWASAISFNVVPEAFIMFSDLLLLLAGFLLTYSLRQILLGRAMQYRVPNSLARLNKGGVPSLTAAALIIVYWHVPIVLDSALLNFSLHVVMHLSLLVAGALIFLGASHLTGRTRKMASILGCKAMGIFGVFLLVTSGVGYHRFYSVYPISQQAQLGLSMMIMMFVFEGFLVPFWLYQYFNHNGLSAV